MEQGVGGEQRGAGSWKGADPICKELTSGNLELHISKWDPCRKCP